ncbi:MAG: ankyrin repeat domain-containing protein [Vicinamibacterales bacterium]
MTARVATFVAATLCASCGTFSPSTDDLRGDPHGHLIWAARTGDVAAIRALAAAGIDLDASTATARAFVFPDLDHRGWTALQHAVQKRRIDVVRVLLECGASADARQAGTTTTPLVIAAGHEDPAIMRLLLAAGADPALGRQALTEEAPGGPLWHVIERIGEHVSGDWSRSLALERLGTTGPSRP